MGVGSGGRKGGKGGVGVGGGLDQPFRPDMARACHTACTWPGVVDSLDLSED